MKYVVIVLILALLLGPVVWLRPSPVDQRRERQRNRARALGLQVRVCDLPQTRRERVRREHTAVGASYSLLMDDREMPAGYWLHASDGSWQDADGDPLPAAQQDWLSAAEVDLPAGVVALQRGGRMTTAYWDERGGEGGVDAVAAVLRRLPDLPQG